MKILIRITSILILISIGATTFGQKKLQVRLSLGNGKPFSTDRNVHSTFPNGQIVFDRQVDKSTFQAIKDRVFMNPQSGVMLEYMLNKHDVVGIGISAGRTELNTAVKKEFSSLYFDGGSNAGGSLKKIGIEYTRNIYLQNSFSPRNKILNRMYFSLLVGAHFVNHKYLAYEAGSFTFLAKDKDGITVDSSTSKDYILNNHGFIASVGLRVGFLNKRAKEKLSLTCNYDQGFVKLWQHNYYNYFDYLSNHINSSMATRGSQFKIYLSMPITLYDLKKDRYRLFKK